ncbi:MAG: aminoglycoside phosphotransferase family protein [Chloroflexi bacterium]|nr:aminoglycoside phosphotransferase family protein [Chloroflexota bacterium]
MPQANNICHGDFHPDNVMLTSAGPIIIDWIDATIGHPAADIARTKLLLTIGTLPDDMDATQKQQITQLRHTFYTSYQNHTLVSSSITTADIDAWFLPIAAARLEENVPGDERPLLQIIRSNL